MVLGVTEVDEVEASVVLGHVRDGSDTADVLAARKHDGGALLELVPHLDFPGLEVVLDGVVFLDVGVWESDGAAVVGHDIRHLVWAHSALGNFTEFVSRFAGVDFVSLVAAFDVVKNSEVFASLVDGEHVHEATWEGGVSDDSVVDFDESFFVFDDFVDLNSVQGVSKSVSENQDEGNALSELVGSGRRTRSLNKMSETRMRFVKIFEPCLHRHQ